MMKLRSRTGWIAGEWDNEPDQIEWRCGNTYCIINRLEAGQLSGFIGVTNQHQWYGKFGSELELMCPALLVPDRPLTCGLRSMEDQSVWCVGFTYGLDGDLMPGRWVPPVVGTPERVYYNVQHVTSQINTLLRHSGERHCELTPLEIIDEYDLRAICGTKTISITGIGADLIKRWIRLGRSHLGIAVDYLEDYPQCTPHLTPKKLTQLATHLRLWANDQ